MTFFDAENVTGSRLVFLYIVEYTTALNHNFHKKELRRFTIQWSV